MFVKHYHIILSFFVSYAITQELASTSGSMGSVTIDGKLYNQVSIRPEITYGRLGVGLDLYLYFNDDGIYEGNWDFSSFKSSYKTMIDKVYYLRWGNKSDDLYFRAGSLPMITLGYGILVNKYSNTMQYPDIRRIGLDFSVKIKNNIRFNFVHSDFKQSSPGLLGLRISSNISSIPRLSFGISGAIDLNQNRGFNDYDGDNYPDFFDPYPYDSNLWDTAEADKEHWKSIYWQISGNPSEEGFQNWFDTTSYIGHNEYSTSDYSETDPVSGFSFDISYRLTKNSYVYAQFAQLLGQTYKITEDFDNNLGYGITPIGYYAKYGIFSFTGEYRISSKNFIYNYWDMSYDLTRVALSSKSDQGSTNIITKESTLYKFGDMGGFYMSMTARLFQFISFNFGFQNMEGRIWSDIENDYIEDNNSSLLYLIDLNTTFSPLIDKAQIIYQQTNVTNPFNFDPTPSTIYGYDIAVRISSSMVMLYKRRITYEINGKGNLDEISSMQIETQMKF